MKHGVSARCNSHLIVWRFPREPVVFSPELEVRVCRKVFDKSAGCVCDVNGADLFIKISELGSLLRKAELFINSFDFIRVCVCPCVRVGVITIYNSKCRYMVENYI